MRNSISREKSDQQARDKERRITLLLVISPNLNVSMRILIGSINVMNPKVWLKITRNHRSLSRKATSTHCNLSIFVSLFQSFIQDNSNQRVEDGNSKPNSKQEGAIWH
ncbi:hypothetical protein [Nostoc sp.]|uniref:hypothetical protein n=1 Tax=Nostoc sp. TaxID=1180 RepID=UPI002FF9532D